MNDSSITDVWTPRLGGLASSRIRYPGFVERDKRRYELVDGDCRVLRLSKDSLVKLSIRANGERSDMSTGCETLLLGIDDSNRFTLDPLGIDDAELGPLNTLSFRKEPLESRLCARILRMEDAKVHHATAVSYTHLTLPTNREV